MVAGGSEEGRDARLRPPLPDEPRVGPGAGGKAEGVEDDRLAAAGLAGERRQPRPDGQVQGVDQHHVADAQAHQHGRNMDGNLARLNRVASPVSSLSSPPEPRSGAERGSRQASALGTIPDKPLARLSGMTKVRWRPRRQPMCSFSGRLRPVFGCSRGFSPLAIISL